jgi:hypothetical protein
VFSRRESTFSLPLLHLDLSIRILASLALVFPLSSFGSLSFDALLIQCWLFLAEDAWLMGGRSKMSFNTGAHLQARKSVNLSAAQEDGILKLTPPHPNSLLAVQAINNKKPISSLSKQVKICQLRCIATTSLATSSVDTTDTTFLRDVLGTTRAVEEDDPFSLWAISGEDEALVFEVGVVGDF